MIRLAATLALLASPLAAEPRQHGNVIFDVPEGWSPGAIRDGVLTVLFDGPDELCEFCSILIGPDAPAQGSLTDWLEANAPLLVEEEDRAAIEVLQPAEASGATGRPLAMQAFAADGDIVVAFALQAGGRFQLLGFEGWAYDEEEVARTLAFLSSDASPLMDRFRYVSEGAAPLMPPPVPGGMDGLWWGWWNGFSVGLDGMMVPQVEQRTLVFWPDGRFYDGQPPLGLAPLDADALRAAADPDWGTYREGPGTIELRFADGRAERLTRDGEGWSDGTATLSRARPLADGGRLVGTVSSFFYTGFTPGSGIEGGVSSSSSTTFALDGTYRGDSFGGAFGNFTDGGGITGGFATQSPGATGGTYEIRDGLVVMTPADGSPPTADLGFVADGEVVIGGRFLDTEG